MFDIEINHNLDDPEQVAKALLDAIPGILGNDRLDGELEVVKKAISKESQYSREKTILKYPQAFRDLLIWYFERQDHNLKLMLDRILYLLETGKDGFGLKKAVPTRHEQRGFEEYWMPYSIKAIKEIRDIVTQHMEGFLYEAFNVYPTENKLRSLVKRGVIQKESDVRDVIHDATVMAMVVDALDRGVDLKSVMDIAKDEPLSPEELEGIKWARENAAQHIRGLYRIVEEDIDKTVSRAARAALIAQGEEKLKRELGREITRGIIAGESWQQLSSHLKHHWGNYSRDWDRVAFTELSYIEKWGRAMVYLKKYGPDVKVIKVPFPDACDVCNLLYLDESGKPRVFTLSELMANGSNGDEWLDPEIGEYRNKRASRIRYDKKSGKFDGGDGGLMPTIGPIHPWCRCVLMLYVEPTKEEVPHYIKEDPEMMDIWNTLKEFIDKETTVSKAAVRFVTRLPGGYSNAR